MTLTIRRIPIAAEAAQAATVTVCERPVIIIGAPRSGTTMLGRALNRHPRLWCRRETNFLAELVDGARGAYAAGYAPDKWWLSQQQVSEAGFLRAIGRGINALFSERAGGLRWVEQTPGYTFRLETLPSLFPSAQFLWLLRDGRQVVHSVRHCRWFDLADPHREACIWWRNCTRNALALGRSDFGDQLLTVRYEQLVTAPERTFRQILAFLAERGHDACAEFVGREPVNSSFTGESSADKLRPRWTSWSRAERKLFHELAGDLLVELGYEPNGDWAAA